MAMVPLKGLHTVRMRGRTYYYAWRGGPRLMAEYGSPAFHAEFADARNPFSNADRSRFGTWVGLYQASDEYKKLAVSTKRQWKPWLDKIKAHFGDLSVRQFDRPAIRLDIRKWRNKWKDAHRTADYGKQVLSRVVTFCVSEGVLAANLCAGVPNLYEGDRSDIIWTPADIDALCKVASPGIQHACRLGAYTGLRQGDLLRLAWNHIEENAIELRTGKSGRRRSATVPLYDELRAFLKTIPQKSPQVLLNSDGLPWKSGFSASWNTAMKKAGLKAKRLHFHDLRGTAATNFYRAGFTIREIAVTLGWSENRVERLIDRYVKRDEILRDRIQRLRGLQAKE